VLFFQKACVIIFYINQTSIFKKEFILIEPTKTCNVCKRIYDDWMETQEFHHINFIGGYGSIFGDEMVFKLDLCQYCLKEMIEKMGIDIDDFLK